MKKTIAAAICGLAMIAVPAIASATTTFTPKLSALDTSWVQTAIQADMAQAQVAALAESKTTNKAALKLAEALGSTHATLLSHAETVAHKLDIAIPTSTGSTYASELSSLSALSGRAFVTALAKDEISGYQQFIALTTQEIDSGENLRVKAVAALYLPALQSHLGLAMRLATALGTPGTTTT